MSPSPLTKGFSLIEMILVIGIIIVLGIIIFLSVNPGQKASERNNAQRKSDVTTILNTVYTYAIDHTGTFPNGIPTGAAKEVCLTGKPLPSCVNLDILTKSYLSQIPSDPLVPQTGTGSKYTIVKNSDGHLTVSAIAAEDGVSISVTR